MMNSLKGLQGLQGKRALVCASTRGLGLGVAKALASMGAQVVINGRTDDSVAATLDLLSKMDGEFVPAPGDVSTIQGRQTILAAAGDVDILINNAGGPPPGFFEDWSEVEWVAALEQNMIAPIMLTKAVVPAMRANGWGRVVNITSASVRAPIPHLGLSNGARAGLTGAMAGIARQVAGDGITINNVLPGQHETDRLRANYENVAKRQNLDFETAWENGKRNHPTGQFGNPDDFGSVVAFLCTDQAKFIVGQNIMVDGGAANISI